MIKRMKEISFVVQGPVIANPKKEAGVYTTAEVLESIRKHYPEAEIILSTWKGTDTSNLVYDKLVLSEDPGGFKLGGLTMNYNRLILSTKAGIEKASHRYVVKTRTDIIFTGNNLYDHLGHITPINGKYVVFNKYVLSTIYYVRNPIKLNLVFHPSDIFLMGEKDDILSHFDVPLPPREYYFNDDDTTKIVSEQYFFVHNIYRKKQLNYSIPKWGYINLKYFLASEKYLFNNFIFFDTHEMGIQFPDRLYAVFRPKSNYTLAQAKRLSKVFIDRPLYGPLVILSRATQYFVYHYMLYYPKILWHHGIKPLIGRTKHYLTN
ncbi:hypothetical protein ACVW2L_000485 [Mucilaginibacter sp. HD30]